MRYALVLAVALGVVAAAAQKTNDTRPGPPKKGDTVVVKGCLHGQRLESTEVSALDAEGTYPSAWTWRLQGKKDLLKELRAKHDGTLVAVTGTLKSELPDAVPGRQVGRTRITMGVDPYGHERRPPGSAEVMPVLDVRSFEPSGTTCK